MTYVSPGVYIEEKQVGGGVAAGGMLIPCIVGKGLKTKRHWNETMVRGEVKDEVIIHDATGTATLSFNSNQLKSMSVLTKNNQRLPADSFVFTAANQIMIEAAYRDTTAVWKFTYIATNRDTDPLSTVPLDVRFVSKSSGGARSYVLGRDYVVDETAGAIDWSISTPAMITGVAGPFDMTTNDTIRISIDGRAPQEITLTGASQNAVTAEEIAADINAALSAAYGASYGAVATVDAGKVKITSVQTGIGGLINFFVPSAKDATNVIFGITAPMYYRGSGVKPALGSTYFIQYDVMRPIADYDKVHLFFQYSDAIDQLGPMTVENELLIAVEIAFKNGARLVGAVQVNDADGDGIFMMHDWMRAIDSVRDRSDMTELVLLNGDYSVISHAVSMISDGASLLVGHLMAGYFGPVIGTEIGSPDMPGTICYGASQVAQVRGNDPARGRFLYMGVPDFRYQILEADTNETIELTLDGYMLGAAVAGYQSAMMPISDSMLRKQFRGPVPDSITTTESQAAFMSNFGVFTVINRGGAVICFDAVTTDQSGDELFVEPNIRPQKDHLARLIRRRLDEYAIGVVPDDLADFANEIKVQIGRVIQATIDAGIISPFRDERTGRVREVDFTRDISVYQSQVKKTEFRFKYWFQARWTVKRMFGEFIVDTALL